MRFRLFKSKFLIVILFLASIMVSCKKEENDDSSTYVISGKIEKVRQIESIGADEIRVYGENNYLLASCPISSDGQFQVKLSVPPSDYLDSVNNKIPPAGLNLSNETSKGVNIDLIAYKRGKEAGRVEKLQTEENVIYLY